MKKRLSILLRLLIAAAGLTYIAVSLTWSDHVVLPAGYALPDGRVLTAEVDLTVTAERPEGVLVLVPPDVDGVPRPDATPRAEQLEKPLPVAIPREQLDKPDGPRFERGILTTLADSKPALLLLGLVVLSPIIPLQALRWLWLLRCRGLNVRYGQALKLTLVGLFFNFCMPGMTGGDIVKAYYASRSTERRGVAVMSVVVDRVTGLFALVLLAGLVGLMMLNEATARQVTLGIWLLIALGVGGALVYFSQGMRRILGVHHLLSRLKPQNPVRSIDQALLAYRHQPLAVGGAVAISLLGHICQATATAMAGWALGVEHDLLLLLTILPVIFVAGALPMTYFGLGVMEGMGRAMLEQPELATANQIVGMLVMLRLYLLSWGLVGAVVMLRGDFHLHVPDETSPGRQDSERADGEKTGTADECG